MQVSAKVHYGCLAMLELALRHGQDKPVSLREIVAQQNIPQPFLVQILQALRAAGLVISTRGSSGGYRLAIDPDSITMLEIAEAIGFGSDINSLGPEGSSCSNENDVVRQLWIRADEAAREVLQQSRLSDLAAACSDGSSAMFYI